MDEGEVDPSMEIRLERAYDEPSGEGGVRVLVDRLWPRGISKQEARLDAWLREVAPSDELREWFGYDPDRWERFKERYFEELDDKAEVLDRLAEKAGDGPLILVYGAKDERHNNAVALKEYLAARRGS